VTTADQARDAGMAQAIRAQRVQLWKQTAELWVACLLPGMEFTADDLVREVGKPDEGDHRANAIGALISAWSKRGVIEWVGTFRKSERVEGHGNLQRLWRKRSLDEAAATRPRPGQGEESPAGSRAHAGRAASSSSERGGAVSPLPASARPPLQLDLLGEVA
jgi:hypothetical protein